MECNARHRWNGREACSAFFVKIEQASAYQYCSVRRREQKARCLLLHDEEAAFRLSIGEQVNCTRGNHQLETDISESLEVHEYRTVLWSATLVIGGMGVKPAAHSSSK